MVSKAQRPSPFQIAFQVQGEGQKSLPIREKDFSKEQMETYLAALCQDCEAFQGRASYADHILLGYHIRYDDMARDHLTGLILPADVPHIPGHPGGYMHKAIFMFTLVLKKGEAHDSVRQLMLGFPRAGQELHPCAQSPLLHPHALGGLPPPYGKHARALHRHPGLCHGLAPPRNHVQPRIKKGETGHSSPSPHIHGQPGPLRLTTLPRLKHRPGQGIAAHHLHDLLHARLMGLV